MLREEDEPSFLKGSFLWDGSGYHYNGEPTVNLLDPATLASKNPWLVLAATLEQAKRGDHRPVHDLFRMVTKESLTALVEYCLALVGDAGSEADMSGLVQLMRSGPDDSSRVGACEAALHAGYLWLAPHVLETWKDIRWHERDTISLYLSDMLEQEAGDVFDFGTFKTDVGYIEFVSERISELGARYRSEHAVVMQGRLFSVRWLTDHMLGLIKSGRNRDELGDDFAFLRHRFEASTGVDCTPFYSGEDFQPLAAATLLQEFRRSPEFEKYEDGKRYFFGHPIPI